MRPFSRSLYLTAGFGVPTPVESAGTPLENPYVFDSVARELKAMEHEGLLRVLSEGHSGSTADFLIDQITFERLR